MDNYLTWGVERWYSNIYLLAGNAYPIKSRGFELTYRQKINDNFSYNIGYSHTDTHIENKNDSPMYHPQHNGYRVALNYQNRGLKANLLGVMASGLNTSYGPIFSDTDTLFSYPSGRYAVLDFNLTYDVNDHLSCYFKVLNLTNQCYSNYTSELIYSDGIKSVHHSPGRSFVYGVEARF